MLFGNKPFLNTRESQRASHTMYGPVSTTNSISPFSSDENLTALSSTTKLQQCIMRTIRSNTGATDCRI